MLTPSGRYAHTKQYVVDVASAVGFTLLEYDEIVPRMEGSQPVQGHLFVFSRRREMQVD